MEVRSRSNTLCISRYERESYLITTELDSLVIDDRYEQNN